MTWLGFLAAGPMLALLVIVFGYAAARLLGLAGLTAWGIGPALSLGFLGVLAVGLQLLGIPWHPATVVASEALMLAICAGAGHFTRPLLAKEYQKFRPLPLGLPRAAIATITIGAAWALMAAPLIAAANFTAPLQSWDTTFHMNAVWVIEQTGNASSLNGLTPMYGAGAPATYYPAVWHSLAALLTMVGVPVAAANNTVVLLLVLMWIIGMTALVRLMFLTKPVAIIAAPLLAVSLNVFPARLTSTYSLWPNSLSLAALPGVLVVFVILGRSLRRAGRAWRMYLGQNLVLAGLAAWALLGAVLAHPSALFTFLAFLAPAAVVAGLHLAWRAWKQGRQVLVGGGAALLLVAAVSMAVVFATDPRFQMVLAANRGVRGSFWHGIYRSVVLLTQLPWDWQVGIMMACTGVGTVTGAILLWRRPGGPRWVVLAWAAGVLLSALTLSPDNPLQFLAGPWYTDLNRVQAIIAIPAVILMTQAVVSLGDFLADGGLRRLASYRPDFRQISFQNFRPSHWRNPANATGPGSQAPAQHQLTGQAAIGAVGQNKTTLFTKASRISVATLAVMCLATGGWNFTSRYQAYRQVYAPTAKDPVLLASPAELKMLESLDQILPKDAVIIGDPVSGAAYAQALGNRKTVFPQLGLVTRDEEIKELGQNFHSIHRDPDICAVLSRTGATHYYADADGWFAGKLRVYRNPGFYDVDVSQGFELVAQAGTARVYKITACD